MKIELDKKLVKNFPLLYSNRGKSMQETCMYWGFSCGDGWFDIIYDLSSKLEPLIAEIAEANKEGQCSQCMCKYTGHDLETGKCNSIHKLPYSIKGPHGCVIPQWKRDLKNAWLGKAWWYSKIPSRPVRLWERFVVCLKQDWQYTKYRFTNKVIRKINKLLNKLFELGLYYNQPCHCKSYEVSHPRASQVKEKFGTLRFYMTTATGEMWDLIREAEQKSATTCETCGASGAEIEKRDGWYWLKTLCPPCRKQYNKERYDEEDN